MYSDSLLQESADRTQADFSKKEIWARVRRGAHLTTTQASVTGMAHMS